jgi:hypothetical protein
VKKTAGVSEEAYGIFEREAFRDKSVADRLKSYAIGSKVEHHPEASGTEDDEKTWHIYYVRVPHDRLQATIGEMQGGMYDGWYSLLWDSERIHVIFNSGVRSIANRGSGAAPSFDVSDVKGVMDLAKAHGLSEEYMSHYLRVGINDFISNTRKNASISDMIRRLGTTI